MIRRLTPLWTAVAFLTVIPVPGSPGAASEPRAARTLFPLVGLGIGLAVAPVLLLPIPSPARGALALALWTAITGGLHEDGWADCMDAAFAHVSRERRIEILGDPRVGAHGVTGTVLLLLLRFGALASVPAGAVLVAPVLGRWAMSASLSLAPPLRPTGLGARWSGGRPWAATLLAALILGGLATAGALVPDVLAGPTPGATLLAAGTAMAVATLWGRFLVGRFGGLSGDGHGSVGLAAETGALLAFLPMVW